MSSEPALADVLPRRWLMLVHQLPPEPAYFRVKIWRQIQALGAVPLKNSVYVLPAREETREDFQWLIRAIAAGGGEATLMEARLVDGFTDPELEALFQAARNADYEAIAEEARLALKFNRRKSVDRERQSAQQQTARRLRRRLGEVAALDFFGAERREAAEGLVAELEARLAAPATDAPAAAPAPAPDAYRNRVWVTRAGVHVDRIACAWLIRRFVDPKAEFKFVAGKDYRPKRGELRFDMFEAEFTHEGERCSLEVMLDRFRLDDPALAAIAEIVHDIDLKDGRYAREETAGLAHLIHGLCLGERDDEQRLARGAWLLDDLYQYFKRKR